MKRKTVLWKSWVAFLILLFLPGCWDLDYLKDARMVLGSAFDLTEDGKIEDTVAVREISGGGEQFKLVNELYTTVGDTPRECRDALDRQMSGEFRAFKNLVVLLGEDLAKQDIYPVLDVIYRDPKAALTARIAVVEGKAGDILKMDKVGVKLVSEYLFELLQSDEDETYVPRDNLLSIRTVILDPGQDAVIPYVRQIENHKAETAGVALFHQHRFTGMTLNPDESLLLLLMKDEKGKTARITKMVNEEAKTSFQRYISFDVEKVKRKMEVEVNPVGKVKVRINLHLQLSVDEFPPDHLDDPKVVEKMNQKLSEELTMDAKRVIKKLQDANCDAFGIGRYLIAFHNDVWKQKNWNEEYAKVQFEPKIEVEIVKNGIIN